MQSQPRTLLEKMKSLGLRHLFIFTFFVLGSLIIGIGGYLLWLDYDIDQTSHATIRAVQGMESAQNLQEHLFSHKRQYLLGGLTGNQDRLHSAADSEKFLQQDLDRLDSLGAYPEQNPTASADFVHSSIKKYLDAHRHLREKGTSAIDLYRDVSDTFERAYDASEALILYNIEIASQNQKDLEHLGQIASAVGGGIVLLSLMAIGALAFALRAALFKPLTKLRDAIIEMKKTRSFSVRAPVIGSSDMKQISSSFNELSADLDTQQKLQFRFIATIAHDIKNPLGAMAMSTDLLSDSIQNQEGKETLAILKRQMTALQTIVKDLLEASTIDAGVVRTEVKEFDLNDLLAKCVSLSQMTALEHRFIFSPTEGEAPCLSDPDRLTQVMNNLLSNAIKYSPVGSEIQIAMTHTHGGYRISVLDNGIGIPEESLESIFHPFQRVSHSKESAPGTGLGLSSCKRIMTALGGSISVESALGQGSTFIIELPERYRPRPDLQVH